MPKSTPQKLAYQKERNAKPEEVKKRVMQNKARQEAIKAGRAEVGDDTNVDHKTPLDKGGTNAKSNLRVVSESKNKGWRKEHPDMYGGKKK